MQLVSHVRIGYEAGIIGRAGKRIIRTAHTTWYGANHADRLDH